MECFIKKTIIMLGTRREGKQDIENTCKEKEGTFSGEWEILKKSFQMKSKILINLLVKP